MVKVGQTTRGTNHGCKYLWLVKNMQVFRNYDKKACYEVLAFNGNGWFVLFNGTLVDCRKFIGNEEIVESLDEDVKKETEKHYADYTSEDFIKSGIAKECTDCPDFCEEGCIENAECSSGNDVFDGCKTVKDDLQPNKTIIEKIENINHCPNQNTCCIVSPLVHCNYNYKSDSCIKAHKNFIHDCEQVHKQMKAKHNPEWHHVSLATLANIDNNMLDDKRRLYLTVWGELNKTLKNLHKCNSGLSYERALSPLRRWVLELYHNKKITDNFKRYVYIKISMCNVECGVWASAFEVATGQHESRKYNKATLRY